MSHLTKRRWMVLFAGVVGAVAVTASLLTGPEGHVLIDRDYPGPAAIIMERIAKLGVDIADVKVLLNSHAHSDHASRTAAVAS